VLARSVGVFKIDSMMALSPMPKTVNPPRELPKPAATGPAPVRKPALVAAAQRASVQVDGNWEEF